MSATANAMAPKSTHNCACRLKKEWERHSQNGSLLQCELCTLWPIPSTDPEETSRHSKPHADFSMGERVDLGTLPGDDKRHDATSKRPRGSRTYT